MKRYRSPLRDGVARLQAGLAAALLFVSACSAQAPAPDAKASGAHTSISHVDLIVNGDYVVTQDDARPVIEEGAVAIKNGMIVAVGPAADIRAKFRAAVVLDGEDRVVMPGLVNGHTHAAMTLLRGIADDIELIDWLRKYIFPTEVKFANAEFVRIGTELACWEMIRGGTTTFVDMYYFPESVAKAVESCGLRAMIAPTVIDQKSPDAENAEDSLRKAAAFVQRWKGKNNRIIPIISAHAVYTVTPDKLRVIRDEANELGVPMSIHLSESKYEVDYSQQHFGKTPVMALEAVGFFNGPTIGAHVIYPTAQEIPVLAKRRVGAIHCPSSNMKISSGIAPVPEMLRQGVPMGIGTDGTATNNDLDMFEEMRLAAFLSKVATMDPKVVAAPTALRMATRGGAEAIGLGDQVGSLIAGRRADLVQVSLADPHLNPMYDVISHLVYAAHAADVVNVIVDGKIIMRDRDVLTIDEARVRKEAAELAAKIKAAVE
jgi:5-methylthioadenosine/S-adenosylhomocysteine deaminase